MRISCCLISVAVLFGVCTGCTEDVSSPVRAKEVVGASRETSPEVTCDYTQVHGNAQHTGNACMEQRGLRVVASVVADPDAQAENAQAGFLQVHEGAPLTSGDYVLIPSVHGFVSIEDRTTQTWSLQVLKWNPGAGSPTAQLEPVWSTDTDWRPVDAAVGSLDFTTGGYVQGFYSAIFGGSIYTPGASGTIVRRSLATGTVQATINPFAGTSFNHDVRLTTAGAPSVAVDGTVYYTAVAWPLGPSPFGKQPRTSWLIKVNPDNSTAAVEWVAIAKTSLGIPATLDLCEWPFSSFGQTPTSSASNPPLSPCGAQRPTLNSAPAINATGTALWVYSAANNQQAAAFLIQLDTETLAPHRALDLRGRALHGCGVRLPIDPGNDENGCAAITDNGRAHFGFHPDFNRPVPFQGTDLTDSSPVLLPSGNPAISGYDGGFSFGGDFDARGFGLVLDPNNGSTAGVNKDFGWEVTPTVFSTPHGFALGQDRNLYADLDIGLGIYNINGTSMVAAQIKPDLDANALDFLDGDIAFDTTGSTYGVNADGHLYKFNAEGRLLERVVLPDDDGEPLSMEGLSGRVARDRAGRIYVSYAGRVYVIAGTGTITTDNTTGHIGLPTLAQRIGHAIKKARIASVRLPGPVH